MADANSKSFEGKTLILVRHAKSSWDNMGMPDEERPLNERGKKDAPEMARRLRNSGIRVDLFLTSPAKRARKTARFFAEEFDVKKGDVVEEDQLYAAGPQDFSAVVSRIDDAHNTVVLFSHNPGLTDYANSLTSVRIDNMPTCGMFAVQASISSWKEFVQAEKKFLFFDYPKNPIGKI